jgi:conjugative relaxase-like TrwC/TraI family protein
MPKPTSVATIARIKPDGKKGARRYAKYIAGGAKIQEVGMSEREIKGTSHYYAEAGARWFGGSCAALGVIEGSVVHERDLERLLRQEDPRTGELLPNNGTARAKISAFDLTISVPKELSIYYMMADFETQKAIYKMLERANRSALEYADTYASKVRRGKGGVVTLSSDGLVGAGTFHSTTRPVKGMTAPGLHFHNAILNMAARDGVVSALDAKEVFSLQGVFAALAGQIITEWTEENLNFHWVHDDKGIPRVEGFDEGVRQKLSLRQQQTLESAIAAGADITRRKDMAYHQRVTKEGKSLCDSDGEALAPAKQMMVEMGYTIDVIDGQLAEVDKSYSEREQQVIADRTFLAENFESQPEDGSKLGAWRFRVALALTGATPNDAPRQLSEEEWRRLNAALETDERTPEQRRDDLAREVMMSVGRLQATWHEHDLQKALLVAGIPREEAIERAKNFIASTDAIRLFGDDDDPTLQLRVAYEHQGVFATKELVEKEDYVFEFVKSGIGQAPRVLNEVQFDDVVAQMRQRGYVMEIGSEQYQMVYALLCGTNRVSAVAGLAGSGKTTGAEMYSLALAAGYLAECSGYLGPMTPSNDPKVVRHHVVGMALAAAAAENLEDSTGIPAHSFAMALSRLEAGTLVIEPGGTVLIDESSQASTDQLFRLIHHLERVNARLVMLGDPRQKQSVEAGGMFATIVDTLPEVVVRLHETRRQKNLEERAVLAYLHDARAAMSDNFRPLSQGSREALLRQGVAAEFLDTLKTPEDAVDWYLRNNRVHSFETVEEELHAEVSRYWDDVEKALRDGEDPTKATLIMAKSDEKLRLLDTAAIDEAVRRGHLDPTQTVEFGKRTLLIGQRILSRKVDRRLDVLNGYGAVVIGVEEVVSSYEVTLKGASPYSATRTMATAPVIGDLIYEKFSQERVQREKANSEIDLGRRIEHLETAKARLSNAHERVARAKARVSKLDSLLSNVRTDSSRAKYRASLASARKSLGGAKAERAKSRELVTSREEKLAAAYEWAQWAQAMPDGECSVGLTVTGATPKNTETRLKVRLDDGEIRHLTETFINGHISSGYAVTDQRSQGQSVGDGIAADAPNYTMLSRGRESTGIYQTVPRDRDEEAKTMAARAASLQPVTNWLTTQLSEDRANAFLVGESHRLRTSAKSKMLSVTEQMTVRMEIGDDTITDSVSQDVARANWLGTRKVAVARTIARTHEVSDAIVRDTVAIAAGTLHYHKIDDRLWVKNMPIIVARGDVKGLEHGQTYFVTGAASQGLRVDDGEGHKVSLTPGEVAAHIDSGYAVTAARMRAGIDAEAYVAEAHGLSESDITHLEETGVPTEIVVVDPQLEVDHEYDTACRAQVQEAFEADLKVEPRSHSAMYFREYMEKKYGKEVGIDSLQAEMNRISSEVYEVRNMDPRDLARRDLDREIHGVSERTKNANERMAKLWGSPVEDIAVVEEVVRPQFFSDPEEDAQDRAVKSTKELEEETRVNLRDTLRNLDALKAERKSLDRRYEVITSDAPEDDHAVAKEIALSQARHESALMREGEVAELLNHYVGLRVLDAKKAPRPYHEAAGLILDEKNPGYKQSQELLVRIEEHRAKWGIKDRDLPLGTKPELGAKDPAKNALRLEEYERLNALIKGREVQIGRARSI